jgi:hypothetical protein
VITGLVVTFALAVFSFVRISPSGIGFRASAVWSNEAILVLSQPGFPEYRSVLPSGQSPDSSSLSSLADVYAAFATSDAVVRQLEARGIIKEDVLADGKLPIAASAVGSSVNGGSTPLLSITGEGDSPAEATKLAVGTTDTFISVLRARQVAAKIPESQRIEVRVVKRAGEPTLVKPRSKTAPIILLLAGITATIGAAFVRDNSRRGPRDVSGVPDAEVVQVNLARGPQAVAKEQSNPADEQDAAEPARTRWSAQSSG